MPALGCRPLRLLSYLVFLYGLTLRNGVVDNPLNASVNLTGRLDMTCARMGEVRCQNYSSEILFQTS
ncbi:uncharacterized protein ARMOST_12173 [Armillaria ostoyae]|uniref:Uncharacterized protein n=1 Tax=Armillaria ostoyae TaxID=47428 RepID=A0A284RJ87_ARMOS|nr:uncharacterized protein ARMOST_12173 [Armillaria ostoyae]